MPQDVTSYVERLQAAGYQTHGVGKMHFMPDHARPWGFQSRDISEEVNEDEDHYKDFVAANGYNHVDEVNGIRSEYYYIPQPCQLPARLTNTHWVADRSIDFLQRRDRSRPFFLMSSFIRPHPPFDPPTPWNKLYRAAEMEDPHIPEHPGEFRTFWNELQTRYKYRGAWGRDRMLMRTLRSAYYGCISFIDYQIGRILETLGDEADNTVILFTADHGELLGDYGCVGKRTMQEVSARIPLIARWPGVLKPGERSTVPVSLLDVHQTILDAAGAEMDTHPERDSLRNLAQRSAPRTVFSQFSKRAYAQYLASDGQWKYSYSAPDRRETLVDLTNDPKESRNLAEKPEARPHLERLRQDLWQRYQRDGYTDAVTDEGWKEHPQPALSEDPERDVIYQDSANTDDRLKALGPDYYRPVTVTGPDAVRCLLEIIRNA